MNDKNQKQEITKMVEQIPDDEFYKMVAEAEKISPTGPEVIEYMKYTETVTVARQKDEEFKQKLSWLSDEIQQLLCAVSGYADEYAHGYENCGMKILDLIKQL